MNGYCSGQIWLEYDILTRTYQKLRKKFAFMAAMGAAASSARREHGCCLANASTAAPMGCCWSLMHASCARRASTSTLHRPTAGMNNHMAGATTND
jgi:hypothetical protein